MTLSREHPSAVRDLGSRRQRCATTVLSVLTSALAACAPSAFDRAREQTDIVAPIGDDGGRFETPNDAASAPDRGPTQTADGGSQAPGTARDGGPERDGGALPNPPLPSDTTPRDGGTQDDGAPDAGPSGVVDAGTPGPVDPAPVGCVAPPAQGRPLRLSAEAPRIIARVAQPTSVDLRLARPVRRQGDGLLWSFQTNNAAHPSGYATVSRSPREGPWSAAPDTWPTTFALTERLDASGAPVPLLPASFTLPVNPVGVVVHDDLATLYLKRYYGFAGTEMYIGVLTDGYTLAAEPLRLFEALAQVPGHAPLFGTAAYDRDGVTYGLACVPEENGMPFRPCSLGRSPTASRAAKTSYEAFRRDGLNGSWTAELNDATPVLETGDDYSSLSYNAYLGKWLYVAAAFSYDSRGDGAVSVRAAPAPEGPWTEQVVFRPPVSVQGLPARFAVEQSELAQNCGQRLVFSYLEVSEETRSGDFLLVSKGQTVLLALDLQ